MLKNDLDKLINAGILSRQKAEEIDSFLSQNSEGSRNNLLILFGILGAILIGVGIISIIAYNWDGFSRTQKSIFAFVPIVISQSLCFYTLFKNRDNKIWIESSSTLLFFSIVSGLLLISQIYNITGEAWAFILACLILTIPVIYLMKSSMTSLLCIIGLGLFAINSNDGQVYHWRTLIFWPLIGSIIPYYLSLIKTNPNGNFTLFHHWILPFSIGTAIISQEYRYDEVIPFILLLLAGIIYLLPKFNVFANRNPFKWIAIFGFTVICFILSFYDFWDHLELFTNRSNFLTSFEFLNVLIASFIFGLICFFKRDRLLKDDWILVTPVLGIIGLFIGSEVPLIACIIFNLILFVSGIYFIKKGADSNKLILLNFGLGICTLLLVFRFYDLDVSFAWKGVFFVILGLGFFVANFIMLKKSRS